MKTYTKKQFFADVKAEADAIKRNATKKEISKLNINNFIPDDKNHCVYGLMTGECRSKRAVNLIKKCCPISIINADDNFDGGFKSIKQNGDSRTSIKAESTLYHVSNIEAYIMLPNAKNKNLIAYLRGETDKLIL